MSMPRLKDPVYAFDNYDVILLDVLFDLRIASDIRFVPRAARLTKSPVFMFSSAGREGTHGESALYYATRSLRLGAIGFIDKDDVRERPWQALETISRITGWNEWQREWNERFASSAEHFLGGADGPLVRRLTESAREDAAERIRIGSAFGTSLEHETRKIRDRFYYLLCKLFEDCDHIEYDRAPEAGVGAGAKFFVKPFRNGRCDNSKFVKIGQYADLQFEEQNFNQCISGYLDTFTGQVFRPIVRADRYAGIVYSAVGYSDNRQGRCKDLRNLTDLVFDIVERLGTKEEVHRVIEELDHSFFSRLYRERGHLHKRVGRRERRSNEQRSAERFVFDHCGVASVDQWWRREYQDLLPPAYSFEIDSATSGIERLPSCERSESHTGHVPSGDGSSGHIAGRLVSYKARVTKDEEPEIELQLIDPFRHRRIRVAFKGVDQSKEVLLSYGKWLKVPYEGSQPKQTDVCYELRQRLKESLTDIAVRQRGGEGNAAPVGTPYRTLLKSIGHVSIRDAVGTPDWSILALFHKLCEAMGYLDRDCKQGEVEFNEIPMTLTTIHGDLNLGNIMVGSASDKSVSRNFWLIDFEKTHLYGHLARDFAKLESDVRHFVVSKVLIDSMVLGALKEPGAGAARRELVSALATQRAIERSVWEGSALIGISDPLRTAYEWIRELRQLATSRYGVSQDELKISVFLHCMSSLKFTKGYGNPKQEPYGYFPRLVYYGAAEALSDDIVRIIESANDRHAGESH
ncbi:MAG: hypothetical protein Q7R48_03825 [bacterium]|nr:hypothetical protein [bacterium]